MIFKSVMGFDNDDLFNLVVVYMAVNFMFFIIAAFFLNSMLLNYLHNNHKGIWDRVTDYSSFAGNGTYNIKEYYSFLFSDLNVDDKSLYRLRSTFKQVGLLVIISFISLPIIFFIIMLPWSS